MFSNWMTRDALRLARLGWAATNVIVGGVIPALSISDFSSGSKPARTQTVPGDHRQHV